MPGSRRVISLLSVGRTVKSMISRQLMSMVSRRPQLAVTVQRRTLSGAALAFPPPVDVSCFSQAVRRVEKYPWVSSKGFTSNQFLHAYPETQVRLAYFMELEDRGEGLGSRLVGRAWLGKHAEGPPRHGHGGSQAAILDEAMGGCAWLNGYPVLAGEITVRFLHPLPLGVDAEVTAEIQQVRGRKVSMSGAILSIANGSGERTMYARSTGTFLIVDPAAVGFDFDARSSSGTPL